jgi:hypothetical protein
VIEYQRDIPADTPEDLIEREREHVRAHLAAIADADDDPTTLADAVRVWTARHPDDPTMLRIEAALDAEPNAPYLDPAYDPLAGLDPELYEQEVAAAIRDEEVLRGTP